MMKIYENFYEKENLFKEIYDEIDEKIIDKSKISIIMENDKSLELTLDFKKGLDKYEKIRVNKEKDYFNSEYTGMYTSARDTFLTERYSEQIEKSKLLRKFKKRVDVIKNPVLIKENKVLKKKENFYKLLDLEEKVNNYDEMKDMFIFFVRVFNDKVK